VTKIIIFFLTIVFVTYKIICLFSVLYYVTVIYTNNIHLNDLEVNDIIGFNVYNIYNFLVYCKIQMYRRVQYLFIIIVLLLKIGNIFE